MGFTCTGEFLALSSLLGSLQLHLDCFHGEQLRFCQCYSLPAPEVSYVSWSLCFDLSRFPKPTQGL
ncbi:hypothetical protein M758_10G163600 [Ceratodon purpureus]|uniref:Uncharacterized protein n=1 Tax=Ceratodon purpureus TaxID=3225 RepID=A0A8T0GL73_CERPU|nr:hypothetical protein KC19_10G168200 [Ceratodon purpureus]KAG0604333.1 hypothetical protein M758_10G163600 [Ceratodon purpureus]